jgi:predicted nucleic acid-binding protein
MNDSFFLDTNVFVYNFDTREPAKTQRASELIRSAVGTKRGVVSYQVVQEFFNIALTRFAKPFSVREAEDYLSLTFKPILAVHSSPRLFLEALHIQTQHQFSWYDALIVAAAQEANCSILYTEDMQHGRRIRNLKIEDPFR